MLKFNVLARAHAEEFRAELGTEFEFTVGKAENLVSGIAESRRGDILTCRADSCILNPEQFEKIKTEIPKWEADPIFNTRHKLIIEKKRQEWIDRENNRKLVD